MDRKILPSLIAVLAALAMSAATQAQSSADGPGAAIVQRMHERGVGPGSFAFARIVGDFGGKVVTNAPFSAQVTAETTQTLADGNHIDRKESGTVARDSMGRTRREMALSAIGPLSATGQVPHLIFIKDSVAQKDYILNENKKTVMTIDISASANGRKEGRMKFRMNAERDSGAAQTQSLGTKAENGMVLQGTRRTRTIPAGEIGNEKPIVITTDEWYSPDLHMAISITRNDPRFGTTTYQLTNIRRDEPPQSLFIVPPDYAPTVVHKIAGL